MVKCARELSGAKRCVQHKSILCSQTVHCVVFAHPHWAVLFGGCEMGRPIKDLTGQQFGRLTVIGYSHQNKHRHAVWECQCSCGNKTLVISPCLIKGQVLSCGCFHEHHNTPRGMSKSRLYHIWCAIRRRCSDPKNNRYHIYGGRGIRVCDEWQHDFAAFLDWSLSNGYSDALTIDRIDVNGNYEPSNCRWITHKAQCYNTRSNRLFSLNGKSQTLQEWASELGISYRTLVYRIYRARWSTEKALTTPVRTKTGLK